MEKPGTGIVDPHKANKVATGTANGDADVDADRVDNTSISTINYADTDRVTNDSI